ncbi:tripartite motif-containing protein 2-like [Mercenaria mercenaria]|uniref:tripartite motif-containing protein 2-like n=1 Tax=Mercenaria mercenaria TaxID=6596 RepID=UPI00234F80E7|nr:tripartite motif-containing protein 2-like [Mercenaria mercenaria]
MATGSGNVLDIATRSFRENLKCSVCLDILKSPKALACLHTFCEECIQSNINANMNGRQRSIICPECRQQTTPPENVAPTEWARQLPTNWPLMGFIERLNNYPANSVVPETEGEVGGQNSVNARDLEECEQIENCQMHPGNKFMFYCREHSAILCEKCKNAVHRWGCTVVTFDSLALDEAITNNTTRIENQFRDIHQKLENTAEAMRKNIHAVGDKVDNFQLRLLQLRNKVDLLLNEMQLELSSTEFRDQNKTRFTQYQNSTITECDSLREAMKFSRSEMDVIKRYGTPAQRFIATEQLRRLMPMFERAADDSAKSAKLTEIRREGIEILSSILRMQKNMKNVEGITVKVVN